MTVTGPDWLYLDFIWRKGTDIYNGDISLQENKHNSVQYLFLRGFGAGCLKRNGANGGDEQYTMLQLI